MVHFNYWRSCIVFIAWKISVENSLESTDFLSGRTPLGYFSYLWSYSLNIFCLKALGKYEKWHHFWAHAQWRSPRRRKMAKRAPRSLDFYFLLIMIDKNGFCRWKEERQTYNRLSQIFKFLPRYLVMFFLSLVMNFPRFSTLKDHN